MVSLGGTNVLRLDVGTNRGNLGEKGSCPEYMDVREFVAFGNGGEMRS